MATVDPARRTSANRAERTIGREADALVTHHLLQFEVSA
jgi:hypothetical protein